MKWIEKESYIIQENENDRSPENCYSARKRPGTQHHTQIKWRGEGRPRQGKSRGQGGSEGKDHRPESPPNQENSKDPDKRDSVTEGREGR